MRLSREIAALPGVDEAALMMGTPVQSGDHARTPACSSRTRDGAGPTISSSRSRPTARRPRGPRSRPPLTALDKPQRRRGEGAGGASPASLRGALKAMPGANLALISVPGDFAAAEARKALQRAASTS